MMNGACFPISTTINKHHSYKFNALMRSSEQGDIQTHKRQKHPVQNLKLCRDQTEEERVVTEQRDVLAPHYALEAH